MTSLVADTGLRRRHADAVPVPNRMEGREGRGRPARVRWDLRHARRPRSARSLKYGGPLPTWGHMETLSPSPEHPVLRTILLVEDNPGDAVLVREALSESLPRADDTVRSWRHRAPDLPVVVLTGRDDDGTARDALISGAQDFLPKGHLDGELLRRVLVHACRRHALLRSLERSRDELAHAVAVRDEVLATATHELRSPLAVLRGVASVVGERGETLAAGRRAELLEMVGRQTSRLEELVDDLLELSRHQAAGAKPQALFTQLAPIVHRAVGDAVQDAGQVEARVPDVDWYTDPGWLRRILVNLISNAVKYGAAPIVVSGAVEDGQLLVTVRDHGEGVPEDVLPVLFEPFTRGSKTSTRPGSGLGLAIVARLAEGLGGTVTYEPAIDGGARFILGLPRVA